MIFKTSIAESLITGLGLATGKAIFGVQIQDRAFSINDFLVYICIAIPVCFCIVVIKNNFKIVRKTDKFI